MLLLSGRTALWPSMEGTILDKIGKGVHLAAIPSTSAINVKKIISFCLRRYVVLLIV